MPSLLSQLDTQPRVRDFLAGALAQGRVGQAYLFLGAPGSGKLDAALALAQAIVCEGKGGNGRPLHGCGACDGCIRVERRSHPDVHICQPESATGYLVEQIRDLISDVALAPIRAAAKVYIVDRAEQLRSNTANALLKTIEEPPAGVTFILLGTSSSSILPTIVSRCQCVPFRAVSPARAAEAVRRATGLPLERCRAAVAVAGSPARATGFLKSAARQDVRRAMIRVLDALPAADDADLLRLVPSDLGTAIEGVTKVNPLGGSKKKKDLEDARKDTESGRRAKGYADYLSRGAVKQLEDRAKRELTARNRSAIMECLASARSVLRDVWMRLEGSPDAPVNADAAEVVERLAARATPAGAARALDAVDRAAWRIERNVTPQLALEVMLLDIRKGLTCP